MRGQQRRAEGLEQDVDLQLGPPALESRDAGRHQNRVADGAEPHEQDPAEPIEEDELMQRLCELRDTLRDQYKIKPSLSEQLADAVATEQYELAARLRDEISRRAPRGENPR